MIVRLLVSLWLGLMIAVTVSFFVPSLVQVPAPLLCDGEFQARFNNRGGQFLCTSKSAETVIEISYARYAITATLIWTAICFVPVNILGALSARGQRRMEVAKQAALAAAIPTRATVLQVAEGNTAIKRAGKLTRDVELKLTLEVHPPTGPAYQTTTTWMVNELQFSQVQVGQVVPVKINAEHPERIYPDCDWAEFSGWKMTRA